MRLIIEMLLSKDKSNQDLAINYINVSIENNDVLTLKNLFHFLQNNVDPFKIDDVMEEVLEKIKFFFTIYEGQNRI